jgi:hypothetical protein
MEIPIRFGLFLLLAAMLGFFAGYAVRSYLSYRRRHARPRH